MMDLMDRLVDDNGRLTTFLVVPGTSVDIRADLRLGYFNSLHITIITFSLFGVWCWRFSRISCLYAWAQRCVCCYCSRVFFLECVVTTSIYDELRAVVRKFYL